MIQKRVDFLNKEGELITGVLRIPDDEKKSPAIVICHDFRSNKDNEFIFEIANTISNAGFITLRFDFRHHGESHGEFQFFTLTKGMDDLRHAINFLEKTPQVDAKKIAVIGHSLGANISFLASEKDKRIKAIVSIGCTARLDEFLQSHFREDEIKSWKEKGFIQMHDFNLLKSDFVDDFYKFDVLEAVKKLDIPVLIIHGTNDKRSPFENARLLFYHTRKPTLEIVEGADHYFTNRKDRDYIANVLVNWFLRNL